MAIETRQRFTIPYLRWWICGLLFLATTINYVDRVSMSALNPILQKEIGWDAAGYGWIMFSFQLAYAIMFPIAGRLLDRFGVRVGMIWAVVLWSLAAMAHGLARTPLGFATARFVLGLGEAANFPASVKAVAEWFPKRQRALATGIFNTGTNMGAMAAPLIVAAAVAWSWQIAFVAMGAAGFVWLLLWVALYRAPAEHANLGSDERAIIESDREPPAPATSVHWTTLLRYPQAWAFFIGKMMTDPVWWFYLYWLNTYLTGRGLTAMEAAKMVIVPYLAADFGSIFGGWISGYLIKRGWPVGRARLFALGIFAAGMPCAIGALFTDNVVTALVLLSVCTGCHQAWSANMFTVASDLFPKHVVGSVVGFGSMCGAIGGLFMTLVAGGILQWFGSYVPLLCIAGVMHVSAWVLIRSLAGTDFRPAELQTTGALRESPGLRRGGIAVALVGVALASVVLARFGYIAESAKSVSTAAAGLVASIGVALIGVVLVYAARGRTSAAAEGAAAVPAPH
jgi:ACS family hexuronate transporter-like MFS transporter